MNRFEATVESLLNYQCPEWFRDAKFGIYVHWGIYSVAERGEWYAREMYIERDPVYEHHCRIYGHPSQFGYKDFILLWKAERFDPDRLVRLFKRAGARYFTPCAIHHDNFDLWDSKHHQWNSMKMGPRKDITGLWREATLKHGLRFGVTTHLARTYSWFNVNKGADKTGVYKGIPYDGNNPEYRDFYLEPHRDTNCWHPVNPPESWRHHWASRIKDLIDHYWPDHLYFDGAIPFQGDDRAKTGLDVLAYYYNQNMNWHDGSLEGVACIKKLNDHGYFFDGVATLDIERGEVDETLLNPWQIDDSIGPWGYHADVPYYSAGEIVHELVDIVSKNGNLLLNVPPRADGTLDEETESILEELGRWMDVNGEAIYETRPWVTASEGNLRFTRKGRAVYMIALECPEPGQKITVSALSALENIGQISQVSLLGCNEALHWTKDDKALTIAVPAEQPCDYAYSFKIEFVEE